MQQNIAELHEQIELLDFPGTLELSSEQMHYFREDLAFADPDDFPEEFDLVQTLNWHKFHQLDQQRFILKHRETGAYLRVTINRTPDGVLKNDVRQVQKHYEIRAVYK